MALFRRKSGDGVLLDALLEECDLLVISSDEPYTVDMADGLAKSRFSNSAEGKVSVLPELEPNSSSFLTMD